MSQFIIISLKEGMFENANTLIRTQLGPNGSGVTIARKNQE
jgi:chromosome segregation ATPase